MSLTLADFYNIASRATPRDHIVAITNQDGLLQLIPEEPSRTTCYGCASLSEEEIAENQVTRQIFNRVIKESLGEARFARICHRYSLPLAQDMEAGRPLSRLEIEKVGIGACDLRALDLQELSKDKDIHLLSPLEISRKIQELNPVKYLGEERPAHRIRGGVDGMIDFFYYDPFKMDKKKAHLMEGLEQLSQKAYQERLAKAIVSYELKEGAILHVPDPKGQPDVYEVIQKIGTGDGLVAYALKPISNQSVLPPLLVFRPSQLSFAAEDAIETWFNDLEYNIGETGYMSAKPQLAALMRDPHFCPPDAKIDVLGFSLGGVHAQRFLGDFWSQIQNVYSYNDQSLDPAPVFALRDTINALPQDRKLFDIYIDRSMARRGEEGDIAHFMGQVHQGLGINHPGVNVRLQEYRRVRGNPVSYLDLHSARIHDTGSVNVYTVHEYTGEDLQRQLDNSERGPEVAWYESRRRFIGAQFVYYVIYGLYSLFKTLCSLLRIPLFRSSKRPDAPIIF